MNAETYFSDFGVVLLFIVGGAIFVIGALVTSWLIRPDRPNPEKLTTYESGEDPIGSAHPQFNIRFYLIAIVFLLFDVELVFLFPWATVFGNPELIEKTEGLWGWFSLVEMIVFILVLSLGLAYAWVNGYLDWVKPDPKPTSFESGVPRELYKKINEKYK